MWQSVHPNPTEGKFILSVEGVKASDIIATTLTDIVGMVQRHNSHKVLNDERLEIDISSLKSGTYLIIVETADNYRTFKIVKQ